MCVRELFRNYVVEERAPTRRGSLNLRYRDIAFFRTHRSVVDLTSSRFHRPHVSWRAVDANSRKLMISNRPIGPKKYVKISMSPATGTERTKRLEHTQTHTFNAGGRNYYSTVIYTVVQ